MSGEFVNRLKIATFILQTGIHATTVTFMCDIRVKFDCGFTLYHVEHLIFVLFCKVVNESGYKCLHQRKTLLFSL